MASIWLDDLLASGEGGGVPADDVPPAIAAVAALGASTKFAREDHTHAIAVATTSVQGAHSAADKVRADELHANLLAARVAVADSAETVLLSTGRIRHVPLSTLTTDRNKTISTTGWAVGSRQTFIRHDRSQFVLRFINGGVGGGVLHELGGPGEVEFGYDGTNIYKVRASRENGARTINVKDFGARGDGATDDYTAIQAALDLHNTGGAGITSIALFFPKGIYWTSRRLKITGNSGRSVRMFGEMRAGSAPAGTVIRFTGAPEDLDYWAAATNTLTSSIQVIDTTAAATLEDARFPMVTLAGVGANFGTVTITLTGTREDGTPGTCVINITAADAGTTVRADTMMLDVNSISIPAMGTHTDGTLTFGYSGATVLHLHGAQGVSVEDIGLSGGATTGANAMYCCLTDFDKIRGIGSTGINFERVDFIEARGTLSCAQAYGEMQTAVGTYQADETVWKDCNWISYNDGAYRTPRGLVMLQGGNVKGFRIDAGGFTGFTECALDLSAANGPVTLTGKVSFGSCGGAMIKNNGTLTVTGTTVENNAVVGLWYQSTNLGRGTFIGCEMAGVAPAADDAMMISTGQLTLRNCIFTNTRTATSWAKFEVSNARMDATGTPGSIEMVGCDVINYPDPRAVGATPSALIADTGHSDIVNSRGEASLREYVVRLHGNIGGNGGTIPYFQIPDHEGTTSKRGVHSLYFPAVGTGISLLQSGASVVSKDRYRYSFTAFETAALTRSLRFGILKPMDKLVAIYLNITTAFAGTAGTLVLGVGTTASGGAFTAPGVVELVAPVTALGILNIGSLDAHMGSVMQRANMVQGGYIASTTAQIDLYVYMTSGTGNLVDLTVGSVDIIVVKESLEL
jgi:hypothetical protein